MANRKRSAPQLAADPTDAPTEIDNAVVDPTDAPLEIDKAVVDPQATVYSDALLYLRGGDRECWVLAPSDADARRMFREYASAAGEDVQGVPLPTAGDRVLTELSGELSSAHGPQTVRRLVLAPWQTLARKVAN